jgi:AAHS family 4-hydroxybenzoate transporter-like MFS transporter
VATSFSEAISRQPLRTYSVVTFAVCMLVLIADGMDAQLLGIVAPKVIEDFGIERGTFGVALSAALVGFGLGSWAGGWLGDKVGRRWSLALATVVFSLATIGASLSEGGRPIAVWFLEAPEGIWELAAWRLVGGLGFGSAYANAIALAGEWMPDRWRPVGVTTLSVGTPAGGFVIAALAPTLDAAFGWRGSFVVVGLATLVIVLVIIVSLRDSPSFLLAKGKDEAARAAASKVLDEPFELAPESHHSDRGGGAIGVFDASNLRLNLGVGVAFAAAALVAYAMLSWATTFLTAKGFGFEQASYAVSIGGITSVAGSIAAGLLVQRFGSRAVMLAISGSLMLTLTVFGFMLEGLPAAPDAGDYWLMVVLYGVSGAIFSAGIASLYALMTHAYPSSCRSSGIGFGIFVGRIGAISATALGGWLIDLGGGSLVPFFAVLVISALLFSAAPLVVDRHVPPSRGLAGA